MKIIDDSEDYFLRDFDEHSSQDNTNTPPPAQTNTFEFEESGEPVPPAPSPAPAPAPAPRPRRRRRAWLWWTLLVIAVCLAVTVWIRYYIPCVTDSKIRGYVTNVEKRGIFWRTFEGEMVSQASVTDPSRVYEHDVTLSIPDDSLALILQSWQGTGRPVEVTVKRYYGTLPWRGATNTIVTDVKPVNGL